MEIESSEEKLLIAGKALKELKEKDENLMKRILNALKEFYIDKKSYVTVTIKWETLENLQLHWEGLTSYLKKITTELFGYEKITAHKGRKDFILIFSE